MSSIDNRKRSLTIMINVLKRHGPMTQTRLKDYTNLRGSTASYLVNDLKKFGMVIDSGETIQYRGPGKPGSLLQLNNDFAQFIGCYVEDNLININVVGLDGISLLQNAVGVDNDSSVEETLIRAIEEVMKSFPNINGIGMAMKALVLLDGTINAKVEEKQPHAFNMEAFQHRMKEIFPITPVVIENDANCAAILYQHEMKENKMDLLLYLLNSSPFRIGCSILVQGKILKGYRGTAGQYFEKGLRLPVLQKDSENTLDYMESMVDAVLAHMVTATYLVDPKKIVLSGSVFNGIGKEGLKRLDVLIQKHEFPADVLIMKGNEELDPAKGAALIAMDDYISSFIEKAGAR